MERYYRPPLAPPWQGGEMVGAGSSLAQGGELVGARFLHGRRGYCDKLISSFLLILCPVFMKKPAVSA